MNNHIKTKTSRFKTIIQSVVPHTKLGAKAQTIYCVLAAVALTLMFAIVITTNKSKIKY